MSETASWQPSASIPNLLKRAAIMAEIRRFFADRGVLEVETPCMSQATVTDIHLVPFETRFVGPGHSQGMNLWLMTSPEYHMKRLLVAGCGPVFQLCRSFRNEEMGRYHNPEFTMLEWYRPHYDMYRLMNERAVSIVISPTVIVPASGCSSRFMLRSNVVLPEPLGPIIATTSPGFTSRSIPCSTV